MAQAADVSNSLFVANVHDVPEEELVSVFATYGDVRNVRRFGATGLHAVIDMATREEAEHALTALNGSHALPGRVMHVRPAIPPRQRGPSHVPPSICSAAPVSVPGLHLFRDVLTPEEEDALLAAVYAQPWQEGMRRRVQHYGFRFVYGTNAIDTEHPLGSLPRWCEGVMERIRALPCCPTVPDQLTVNEYPPGHGIASHIDTHAAFEDGLLSLSLGSDCVMELGSADGATVLHQHLPRRSLLLLTGEARFAWTHGIAYRKTDRVDGVVQRRGTRVSLTFRKARLGGACECEFPALCHSRALDAGHSDAAAPR